MFSQEIAKKGMVGIVDMTAFLGRETSLIIMPMPNRAEWLFFLATLSNSKRAPAPAPA